MALEHRARTMFWTLVSPSGTVRSRRIGDHVPANWSCRCPVPLVCFRRLRLGARFALTRGVAGFGFVSRRSLLFKQLSKRVLAPFMRFPVIVVCLIAACSDVSPRIMCPYMPWYV